MRDKIADIIHNADEKCRNNSDCQKCKGFGLGSRCIDYLVADELIANGVILPPVRVGQTVWFIGDGKMVETNAEKIILKQGGIYIKLGCNAMYETTCRSIGKTVFLTKEEAEKALKEKENG